MCKESAKQLRKELKNKLGVNSRQVSVRSSRNSIDVTIKDLTVNFSEVEKIANTYESIRRDHATGEILSGGNTYISVGYSYDTMEEEAKKLMPKAKEIINNNKDLVKNEWATVWENDTHCILYSDKVDVFPIITLETKNDGLLNKVKSFMANNAESIADALIQIQYKYQVDFLGLNNKEEEIKEESNSNSESTTYANLDNVEVTEFIKQFDIEQTQHTKTNENLWVCKLKDRVSKKEFKDILSQVKSLGGYYSKFVGGFIFKFDPMTLLDNEEEDITDDKPQHQEEIREQQNHPLVGKKVTGNWGAMYSWNHGTITKVEDGWATVEFEEDDANLDDFMVEIDELKTGDIKEIGVYIRENKKTITKQEPRHQEDKEKGENNKNNKELNIMENDNKVIKVQFKFDQSGFCEDVYKGIDNNKWYTRCENSGWYVGNPWNGGVEASHGTNNIIFEVVDNNGKVLFRENSEIADSKNYPFTWEVGKNLKDSMVNKYNLITYKEWKKPLKIAHKQSGNNDYIENWMYTRSYINKIKEEVIDTITYYDDKYDIIKEECHHKEANLTWIEYYIKSRKYGNCLMIYGYKYINNNIKEVG